jgi:hypothetical protein
MNTATRRIVTTLGILFAISGVSHGFFETLQGNTPTDGMFISAIGEAHRMWEHGNEYAFTLVPNFLVTGILAIAVSIVIIIWSVRFIHTKRGPLVFLLLFILLLLVGGGVAQVPFFAMTWLVATRVNKPLTWWRKVLPGGLRKWLAKVWPWTLAVGVAVMLFTLWVATTGVVPGVSDEDTALNVMLSSLPVALVAFLVTFVAGFAHDIEMRPSPASP